MNMRYIVLSLACVLASSVVTVAQTTQKFQATKANDYGLVYNYSA